MLAFIGSLSLPALWMLVLHDDAQRECDYVSCATGALINQAHGDPDLLLHVNTSEKQLIEAINGERTFEEIIHHHSHLGTKGVSELLSQARGLFERLYNYDQVVFDTSSKSGDGPP